MSQRFWRMAGGLAIAYVVVIFASAAVGGAGDEIGTSPSQIAAHYAGASQTSVYAGGYLGVLAALAFVGLATFLFRALPRSSEAAGWASSTALGTGLIYAGSIVPGTLAAGVYAAHHGADAGILALLNDVRDFTFFGSLLVLAAFTLSTAIAVLAGGALPRWVGSSGVVSALLLFAGVAFAGVGAHDYAMMINMVWVLALGVAMLRKSPARERAADAVPVRV
jgi:hypothetical protein